MKSCCRKMSVKVSKSQTGMTGWPFQKWRPEQNAKDVNLFLIQERDCQFLYIIIQTTVLLLMKGINAWPMSVINFSLLHDSLIICPFCEREESIMYVCAWKSTENWKVLKARAPVDPALCARRSQDERNRNNSAARRCCHRYVNI